MPTQKQLSEAALEIKRSTKRGYRIEEFCQAYGICRSLAYVEIRRGRLKARKVGRRTLIAAEDAEAWFGNLARFRAA